MPISAAPVGCTQVIPRLTLPTEVIFSPEVLSLFRSLYFMHFWKRKQVAPRPSPTSFYPLKNETSTTKVRNFNGNPGLELRLTNIPPPPPGFEDSGDEFYLDKPEFPVEEPTSEDTETMNLSEEEVERQGEVLMRRTGSGTWTLCIITSLWFTTITSSCLMQFQIADSVRR